ncbi:MAG: hypothetical protein KDD62_04985, partial [Bdellovibrionales bacterium]|nr:hypothetical protein [Bdellovibrionales bacterium]
LPRDVILGKLDELTSRDAFKHFVRDVDYPTLLLRFGDQLRVVPNLEDTERRLFTAEVTESCLACSRWSRTQRFLVHQDLRKLPTDEKIELLRSLIAKVGDEGRLGKNAIELVAITIGGAKDFKELDCLVKKVGNYNLLETKDRRLRDFAAYVTLKGKLKRMPLPARLEKGATRNKTLKQLDALEESLQERYKLCTSEAEFNGSLVRNRMMEGLAWTIEYLQHERERRRRTTDRIELLNVLVKKVKIEAEFNCKITVGVEADGVNYASHWSASEMADLADLHSKMDPVAVTFLPKNAQIRKVPYLEGAHAQRDGTGILKISDYASSDTDSSSSYGKIRSLKIIGIHEYGHSFHFANFGDRIDDKDSIKDVAKRSNPLVAYGDFLALSGWQILPQARYVISDNKRAVKIDQEYRCQLGQPAKLDGKDVVFHYDVSRKLLYYYDAHAQFPLHDYSRDNPWEDFAECFVEYHYLMNRFVEDAPWKALLFEQVFGRYQDNQRVQDLLSSQIEKRFGRTKSDESESNEPQIEPDTEIKESDK